jgi:uncharacterized protein (DUF3820 family)
MEVTRQLLSEMVSTKMPYGQYESTVLCNLPISYLSGFNSIGYPNGKLGILLQALYDIKQEGSEHILEPYKAKALIR